MSASTQTFSALTKQQIHDLLVLPLQAQSVALQVCQTISIADTSIRIPKIVSNGGASWVAENGVIPISDATADEDVVTPSKVAGIRNISRELAEDSSPAAQQVVGDDLVRAISDAIDAAFFGPTLPAPAPAGLRSIGATANAIVMPKVIANVDPLLGAIAHGRDTGAEVTSFVTSPALALELATLKDGTSSQRGDPASISRIRRAV